MTKSIRNINKINSQQKITILKFCFVFHIYPRNFHGIGVKTKQIFATFLPIFHCFFHQKRWQRHTNYENRYTWCTASINSVVKTHLLIENINYLHKSAVECSKYIVLTPTSKGGLCSVFTPILLIFEGVKTERVYRGRYKYGTVGSS